ncbi:ribonuclease pancreatic beta-type-like [Tiliqua scincoides]|uniref:ribonuclease pancreatic beta-type-like n=1 Tax=Tiliqua scincoides TaxID=71010 RepID=UPI003462C893
MALQEAFLMGLCLLSMSAIHISHTQRPHAFQRKYVTLLENMDHNRCNSEMRNKRIALTRSGCKRFNTFIHAPKKFIDYTCIMGQPYVIKNLEYKKSTRKFRVTSCRLSQEYVNDCKYVAEASSWKYILVSCDQNDQPVHLAGTLNW